MHGEDVEIRRDHTATVLSFGEGLSKQMLVNGTGITIITPITKIMAHMPMLAHPGPSSAAVICFGMGTTFRSAMSWGGKVSAIELVGSVRDAFGFYFDDAQSSHAESARAGCDRRWAPIPAAKYYALRCTDG